MSRKNNLKLYTLFSAGDMSGNLTSASIDIEFLDNVSVQAAWTGSPVGTFNVQGSVDQISWSTLTTNPVITAAGSPDNGLFDLNQLSFPFVRLIYTATSGTGTLVAKVSAKML